MVGEDVVVVGVNVEDTAGQVIGEELRYDKVRLVNLGQYKIKWRHILFVVLSCMLGNALLDIHHGVTHFDEDIALVNLVRHFVG